MRQVAGNPEIVQRKITAAKELIAREYSIDAVAQRQLARLRSLEGK
jgi:hypothetical protein